ncbi:hypothetical protein SAMN05216386_0882 [Nitrosospira briensis]|uniref:Uncharacterized protein n=1 Tax=Nitrosospira briensis TaxID=35799 RepID=A0A1I4YTQ3_9PROT|nr:hypothetical protein SAMN05216386_0882 [Nitrosospira briensis]
MLKQSDSNNAEFNLEPQKIPETSTSIYLAYRYRSFRMWTISVAAPRHF